MSKLLYGSTAVLLATIASPVVTSAARFGATTADSLRMVGMAATQYAADNNNGVVMTQQSATATDKAWAVTLQPYLMTPDQSQVAFFDPIRAAASGSTALVGTATLPWYAITSISINDSGYTGRTVTVGGTCVGRRVSYFYGQRNLATMVSPSTRVAFAPTLYPGSPYGYSFFRSYEASAYKTGLAAGVFSWNNLVYDTRNLYPGGLIPVVHADGSAGTLNPAADFKNGTTTSTADQCTWLNGAGGTVWGQYWNAS